MRERFDIRTQDRQNPRAGNSGTLVLVRRVALIALILVLSALTNAQTFSITQAPGEIGFFSFGAPTLGSFGKMNALVVHTPSSCVTALPLSNGALHYGPYQIAVSGLAGGHQVGITAYVSDTALLIFALAVR